jgi:hypothetical protein
MSILLQLRQASFDELCPITAAVEQLASAGGAQERGSVYTRREVVDFILDLVGYRSDRPLHTMRLLEPSFGAGDFLLPAVDRLLRAWQAAGPSASPLTDLGECVRGVELHRDTFDQTRLALGARLSAVGIDSETVEAIVSRWIQNSDFLLMELQCSFDVVIGNPPYVRQELIPAVLLAEYRSRYTTLFDRADLYIPFIERSLRLLSEGGSVGFICADRWMKNRYGGPLRALVAQGFHLKVHVDMTGTPAFHAEVDAYPAITIISRARPGPTRLAYRPVIERAALSQLATQLLVAQLPPHSMNVRELPGVVSGSEPWVLASSETLALMRRLEAELPTIEQAGCKVGIGVATGADEAFIGRFDELDVEDDRKEPLAMTRDLRDGRVDWRGYGVINPFAEGGGLVDLNAYPRLKRYLESRRDQIAGRHCAQKTPAAWYRTIDRISPALTRQPKLLIPDIKGQAHIVFDEGRLYPHHNLYYVTSEEWDLRALQAVLLSGVARTFIEIYSTRMRGGFLRFQAQYLRRIRVPRWAQVPYKLRRELMDAATSLDVDACNRAAFDLYQLSESERALLGGPLGRQDQH